MSAWTSAILRWQDRTGIREREPLPEELCRMLLEEAQADLEAAPSYDQDEPPLVEAWTDEQFREYAEDGGHHGR